MRKPIIGVMPLWDDGKNSIWMLPDYLKALNEVECIPVILPLSDNREDLMQLGNGLDGFLFTGGHDVSPTLYGEDADALCGVPCRMRDRMEDIIFTELVRGLGKPALGICRGIQIFNVLAGGTLYQDIPSQYSPPQRTVHQQSPPYSHPVHTVRLVKDSPLAALLEEECGDDITLKVNSFHHQAIRTLAEPFKLGAISEDGLVEAIYMPDHKYVWAVQWHPEYMPDAIHSRLLFQSFADACR